MKNVIGTFDNRRSAEEAVEQLVLAGFDRTNVSLLVSEDARQQVVGQSTAEGAAVGGTMGGVFGGLLAGLAAVGSIAIPGAGVLAVGPIVAALAGAGAGGAAGTLMGGLVGYGLSEVDAKTVSDHLERGRLVVTARVPTHEADTAQRILRGEGARTVETSRTL